MAANVYVQCWYTAQQTELMYCAFKNNRWKGQDIGYQLKMHVHVMFACVSDYVSILCLTPTGQEIPQ